jgi:hypothetical protein
MVKKLWNRGQYAVVAAGLGSLTLVRPAAAVLSFTVDTADYMAGAGIIIAALATMWGVKQVVRLVR